MFFFHSKNRRRRDDRSTDRVLDVRLRAEGGRGDSAGWTRWILLVMLVGGAAFAANWAQSFIRREWMGRSTVFSLTNFPIETDGVLSREEIELTVRVRRGQNLLLLDLPTLRDRLKLHPRVEDALVERMLPDTLKLTIRERIPVARVSLPVPGGSAAVYLLDESGHAMPPLDRSRASQENVAAESSLPLIINPPPNAVGNGRKGGVSDAMRAALQLLIAFDRSELAGVTEIVSIDMAAPGVLQAFTPHSGTITFRPADFPAQIEDWHRVWNEGAKLGRSIASLDLAVGRNIPLRWQESASPQPPPVRKSTKPKRIRRSHV